MLPSDNETLAAWLVGILLAIAVISCSECSTTDKSGADDWTKREQIATLCM